MAGGHTSATPARRHSRYRPSAEINVTSLVDVTLVLLIIFMLTAPMVQGGVEVDLPKANAAASARREGPVITLDAQRRAYLGQDPVGIDELGELVASRTAEDPTLPVYLRADEDVPYGFVVQVMGELKSAGVETLQLVTREEERPR